MRLAAPHARRVALKVQPAEQARRLAAADVAAELGLVEEAQRPVAVGLGARPVAEHRVEEVHFGVHDRAEVAWLDTLLDAVVQAEGLEGVCLALVGVDRGFGPAHTVEDAPCVAADYGSVGLGRAGGDGGDFEEDEEVGPEFAGGNEDFDGDEVGEEAAEGVADLAPGTVGNCVIASSFGFHVLFEGGFVVRVEGLKETLGVNGNCKPLLVATLGEESARGVSNLRLATYSRCCC